MFRRMVPCLLLVCVMALGASAGSGRDADLERALKGITQDELKADINILSSDEFEGRGPSTSGEEKTLRFLKDRFEKLGLLPGNGESYFQEIPLTEITSRPEGDLAVDGGNATARLRYRDEYVASTMRAVAHSGLERSEMVFVGYGIVAPEWGWNDYKDIDVRGKTVVMLVNDPGFATGDPGLFNGRSMTYYGRWTYKYEEAARQGAAGALIVHETEPAAYPWGVVTNSFTGPQMSFTTADRNMSRAAVEGWLTIDAARKIFLQAGRDFDELKAGAARRGFTAIPLGLRASVSLDNSIRNVSSSNVLALLPGGARKDECIIYMAHWDHLGIDTTRTDDPIFNGALDNATGVAGLLELAEAFTKLERRPSRSILFLSVTCEEQGLLGSEYYAEHPVFPLDRTVAALNMDAMNIYGPMKDVTAIGFGNSDLDDYLVDAAGTQGRVVRPDPQPEQGFFFRSDHFSLAKRGVPALYAASGIDHVVHGPDWTRAQRDKYTAENYHKPSDEFDPAWDLSGAVDDLRLLFMVGYRLAGESTFPEWKEGSAFKAARRAYMRP
ncbi:MAG: M28 family metallopeptidase [Candidatus Krumholzibacteria bacterium]|nr:M28 family metallopeptidase [Candidatus Krumholzibacteria bacterium]